MDKVIEQAYAIAKGNLKACYARNGFYAGLVHFSDYWARDGFYATFGAVYQKDFTVVKSELQLFMKYQRKNGHIPRKISGYWTINLLTMWLRKHIKEIYFKPLLTYYGRDQNAL